MDFYKIANWNFISKTDFKRSNNGACKSVHHDANMPPSLTQ